MNWEIVLILTVGLVAIAAWSTFVCVVGAWAEDWFNSFGAGLFVAFAIFLTPFILLAGLVV